MPIPVRTGTAEGLRRQLLDTLRVEVPVTQHAGRMFVRLAVAACNTQADLDTLVSALWALDVQPRGAAH